MLRKFSFVTICLLIIICSSLLFFYSSWVDIDYANLQLKINTESNQETIPQEIGENFVLKLIGETCSLDLNFSGTYYRREVSSEIIELISKNTKLYNNNIKYMWTRSLSSEYSELILCFFQDQCLVVSSADNDYYFFKINYDDNKLSVINEMYITDKYECSFKKIAMPKADDKKIVLNKQSYGVVLEFLLKIGKTIISFILEHILQTIALILLSIFIHMFIFGKTSLFLYYKYKSCLKQNLFPEEHSWFGNNSPDDVYVSVKIFQKHSYQEYNLLDYFLNALLDKPNIHVILGNAGEGKTFSLSRIAFGILECFNYDKKENKANYKKLNKLIPIILNFSELSGLKKDDDLIEHIYNTICKVTKKKKKKLIFSNNKRTICYIEKYLSAGKFVFLLDGYDEIVDSHSRVSFSSFLTEFMKEFNKCHYIITSRTQTYEDEPFYNVNLNNTLYLSPLSKEQICEFVSKWSFPSDKSSTELYQRILNAVQLENIVTNPLLLTMIAYTYSRADFLFTNSRIEIYKQCCECLLKTWEEKKTLLKRLLRYKTLDNIDVKIELLCEVAYFLYKNNCSNIKENLLLEIWSKHETELSYFHGKAKIVLDEIINQSGLLEITDKNTLRFRHRTFYEYFVALYLINHNYDLHELNDSEKNITFFYLSMVNNDDAVNNFILNNLNQIKLIQDLLIERDISNIDVVNWATAKILENINYKDISHLQSIGYIARKYTDVAPLVKTVLVTKIKEYNNEQVKINIIIGLMLFCEKEFLSEVLQKEIKKIDFGPLVQYSGDIINDLAQDIMELINDDMKIDFIELLAKTYRFEAIYNIYVNKKGFNKKLAIIGLLYMSKEHKLMNWLSSKKFNKSLNRSQINKAKYLSEKYGWVDNNLDKIENENLFLLVYLCKEIYKEGFKISSELIDNKIAFLISYIISDELGIIKTDLIDIEEFEMKAIIEFSYHWNKRRKMKRKSLQKKHRIMMISTLNLTIIVTVVGTLITHMLFYLHYIYEINKASNIKLDINVSILKNMAIIPFNSIYFVMFVFLFIIGWLTTFSLKKIKYNKNLILMYTIVSLALFIVYMIFVQNFFLRMTTLVALLMVGYLEMIKHRNNYPSFKQPQYNRIIEYLE